MVNLGSDTFEADHGRGITDRLRSVVNYAGTLVAFLSYWTVAAVWAGLWLLVAGLHLREGDPIGVAIAGAMGVTPLLLVGLTSVRQLTDRRPLDVVTPG